MEDWGGKYQSQDVSAKTGVGIPELLEKIILEAEMLDLKANPNRNTYIDNLMDEVTISGGTGGGDLTQIPPIVGGNNQDMFQLNLAGTTPKWNSGGGGGFSLKYEISKMLQYIYTSWHRLSKRKRNILILLP